MLNSKGIATELSRGSISVENGEDNIENECIKVTLGNILKVYSEDVLDVSAPTPTEEIVIPENGYVLEPNKLYLGRTNEYTMTYGFVPLLCSTEELAACGVEIHITAGFGDNGFEGTWTLEIVATNPTILYPDMEIGRIYYYPLIGDSNIEYRGKYFRQVEATASRLSQEYTNRDESTKENGLVRKC